jgi:hypothetical protein
MRSQRVTVLMVIGLVLAAWLMAVPIGWIDHPAQAHAPVPSLTATARPTPTSTAAPTETAAPEPTATLAAPPVAASPVPTIQAAPQAASIPPDVILVGVVMVFALIGIVIGFRAQRA